MNSDFKRQLEDLIAIPPCELRYAPGVPALVEWITDVTEISDKVVGEYRWSNVHETVYEHNGRFWRVVYQAPATEMQDWDTEGTEINEVFPVEVTVTHYKTERELSL